MFKHSLILLCLLVGCEKHGSGPSETPIGSAPARGVSNEAPAKVVANGGGEDTAGAVLTRLTQAVRRYGVEQRRAPATLQQVVDAGYLKEMPAAPAGKRFVIDKKLEVRLGTR
jgi:hypothetical protein